MLKGRAFNCYPGVEKERHRPDRSDEPVVIDRNLITSQGPGTAFAFALKLIEILENPGAAEAVITSYSIHYTKLYEESG